MIKALVGFVRDDSGSAAVEYATTAALMSLLVLAGVTLLGPKLAHAFQLAACLDQAACVLH